MAKTIIMRKLTYVIFAMALATMMSCAPAQPETTRQNTNPQQLNQMQINRLQQDAAVISNQGVMPMPAQAPARTQTTNTANAAGVTINPPHGQPGHRCDIPVGSPLPGAGAPMASAEVRLNPPHGQPGHRCDIPVGNPLP